jgi:hypothetical protein
MFSSFSSLSEEPLCRSRVLDLLFGV